MANDRKRRRPPRRGGIRRPAATQVKRIAADVAVQSIQLSGDDTIAKPLADALAHSGRFDRHTQGFHSYPARLHPLAARDVIALFEPSRVLDPFCGGGTILVEAMLAGATAVGRDLSPVAVQVAQARTALLDDKTIAAIEAQANAIAAATKKKIGAGRSAHVPGAVWKLRDWYDKRMLDELAMLRGGVLNTEEPVRSLLLAVHSSLVVKFSHRASDTSNKRIPMRRTGGAAVKAFVYKVEEYCRQLKSLRKAVPGGTPPADVAEANAQELELEGAFDLVLTSPPYPATYDYVRLQQLRLAWLGRDINKTGKAELGARHRFRRKPGPAYESWKRDTRKWMAHIRKSLADGGRMAIVIGDGLAEGLLLDAAGPTRSAAKACGLKFVAGATLGRRDMGAGRQKGEHLLVFQR